MELINGPFKKKEVNLTQLSEDIKNKELEMIQFYKDCLSDINSNYNEIGNSILRLDPEEGWNDEVKAELEEEIKKSVKRQYRKIAKKLGIFTGKIASEI